jgi:hypothetical protein
MMTYTNFLQRRAFRPRRHGGTKTTFMVSGPGLADSLATLVPKPAAGA